MAQNKYLICHCVYASEHVYSKLGTFIDALEDSGIPFSYFPEMIPQAKGDHVMAPTPTVTHRIKMSCPA